MLLTSLARADRLGQTVSVTCHPDWRCESGLEPRRNEQMLHTLKYVPKDGRNATVLLSVMPNDIPGAIVSDLESLKRFNRMSASPYLPDPDHPPTPFVITIPNGLALAITSEDPALIGKPVPAGEYKIATTVSVLLGRKTLLHCTIYYDEMDSKDYHQAMEILQSVVLTGDTDSKATPI
jgi:hypothetical protein